MNDDATHPLPEPHVGSVLCYYTAEQMRNFAAEQVRALEAKNAALKHDLRYARDGLTKGRTRMREDNERLRRALDQKHAEYEDLKTCAANNARNLAREAHTWSKAAETYAAELERRKPLMQAVEWILEDGHMNQEHLARLRAAWEGA